MEPSMKQLARHEIPWWVSADSGQRARGKGKISRVGQGIFPDHGGSAPTNGLFLLQAMMA
jgi:hypothetical protein